mmetsp:Transcript_56119/g.125288  ORF Transcript_56119/g.125288 Transcript_56119/m.125288 type:complete len:263 (-) Transcript_56119:142-930(-)
MASWSPLPGNRPAAERSINLALHSGRSPADTKTCMARTAPSLVGPLSITPRSVSTPPVARSDSGLACTSAPTASTRFGRRSGSLWPKRVDALNGLERPPCSACSTSCSSASVVVSPPHAMASACCSVSFSTEVSNAPSTPTSVCAGSAALSDTGGFFPPFISIVHSLGTTPRAYSEDLNCDGPRSPPSTAPLSSAPSSPLPSLPRARGARLSLSIASISRAARDAAAAGSLGSRETTAEVMPPPALMLGATSTPAASAAARA